MITPRFAAHSMTDWSGVLDGVKIHRPSVESRPRNEGAA